MNEKIFKNELKSIKPFRADNSIEDLQKELGLEKIEVLALNENHLGPSPKAVEAIIKEVHNINTYPDASYERLKEKLAQKLNISTKNIVLGNGGDELIKMISETFINPFDEVIMASTTFGRYANEVSFMGGKAIQVPLKNYKHDFDGFISKLSKKTKLIYVCNPNNPTGNIMTNEEVEYLIKNVPENVVIVFDEAYHDYAVKNVKYPETINILKKRPNTVILRSFSKILGIAGVRIGYIITSEEIVKEVSKIKLIFNVNKLAQVAALGALEDNEHLEKTVELNYKALKLMEKYFEEKELEYIKSNANFIFVNVKKDSKTVAKKLLEKGILIREGSAWGWNTWLRVSTGTMKQMEKFLDKLNEVLDEL